MHVINFCSEPVRPAAFVYFAPICTVRPKALTNFKNLRLVMQSKQCVI